MPTKPTPPRPRGRPRLVPPPPPDATGRQIPLTDAEWQAVLKLVTRMRKKK